MYPRVDWWLTALLCFCVQTAGGSLALAQDSAPPEVPDVPQFAPEPELELRDDEEAVREIETRWVLGIGVSVLGEARSNDTFPLLLEDRGFERRGLVGGFEIGARKRLKNAPALSFGARLDARTRRLPGRTSYAYVFAPGALFVGDLRATTRNGFQVHGNIGVGTSIALVRINGRGATHLTPRVHVGVGAAFPVSRRLRISLRLSWELNRVFGMANSTTLSLGGFGLTFGIEIAE